MSWDRTARVTAVACVALAAVVLVCLLETTRGTFALPLDDPYIYFQYARQAAHGALFQYNDGDPATTGATSLLYLVVLTPLALALRGTALAVGAFALGVVLTWLTAISTGRLARAWIGDWARTPAIGLLLLTGPFVWGMLSGMETALVAWLAVLTLAEASSLPRAGAAVPARASGSRFAIAAALLCLARPEAAVLVAAFVVLSALLTRRLLPFGTAMTGVLLVAAATPFAVNLALTGTPGSMTLASKAAPYLPGTTPVTWAIEASQFFVHNLKGLLGGGDAAAATWPSAYTTLVTFAAPLTLPLLVLGLFPPLVEETRARRPGVAWLGALLLFGTLAIWAALVPINLHWSRYFMPFLPFVLLFTLAGINRLSRAFGDEALAVRRGLLVFAIVGTLPTLVFFVAMFAWNAREIAEQHIAMSSWIRAHTPKDSWVGTNDVGAIAYYGGRPVLDLHGLVSRDLAEAKQVGSSAVLEHLERMPAARRPTTLVVIPGWFDQSFLRLHRPVRSQTLYKASIAGSPLVAYQANWAYVGTADRPGPDALAALGDRRLVDALDVADLTSEREHAYALELLPGATAAPIGILKPPGSEQLVPDGGRLVTLSESFEMRVSPGRAAVLVVRAMGTFRASVRVGGGSETPITAAQGGDERWTETAIPVEASLVRTSRIRVVVTAHDGAHQEGGYVSAHWWVFQ